MNRTAIDADVASGMNVTFEQVLLWAERLQPIEQARLVARLAPKVEEVLKQLEPSAVTPPRQPLRGLLADLGQAPSAEEIDEVQGEMWTDLMGAE